jgi:molybdate-binding protein
MNSTVQKAVARVLGAAIVGGLTLGLVSCSAATSGTPQARLAATDTVNSYIVEAQSTDAAAEAVAAAGGKVVSRLNIIDAVEATLTDAQHARVLAANGVKQITTNTLVATQAAANVRDNFESQSFSNNDGTHRWYGDWVEPGDDGTPWGGNAIIGWQDRGSGRMILQMNGSIWRRAATPSNSPNVTLKFKSLRNSLEYGEYVSVQASGNGGSTWTEVGRLAGPANDIYFQNQSYNITAFRGRNTAIRFVASMNSRFGDDNVDIDDLEISYTTTYGEGDALPVDVNAKDLHAQGVKGRDVGVAVIDTGYWKVDSLDKDSAGNGRVVVRQPASGSQRLLELLAARTNIAIAALRAVGKPALAETDLAAAIRDGKADAGIAIEAAARAHDLAFVALATERFDLVVRRRDYFEPPVQALLAFTRTAEFRERAQRLGGYDVTTTGRVLFNA